MGVPHRRGMRQPDRQTSEGSSRADAAASKVGAASTARCPPSRQLDHMLVTDGFRAGAGQSPAYTSAPSPPGLQAVHTCWHREQPDRPPTESLRPPRHRGPIVDARTLCPTSPAVPGLRLTAGTVVLEARRSRGGYGGLYLVGARPARVEADRRRDADRKALQPAVAEYIAVFVIKIVAFAFTGVLALLAEAPHTLSDIFVSGSCWSPCVSATGPRRARRAHRAPRLTCTPGGQPCRRDHRPGASSHRPARVPRRSEGDQHARRGTSTPQPGIAPGLRAGRRPPRGG